MATQQRLFDNVEYIIENLTTINERTNNKIKHKHKIHKRYIYDMTIKLNKMIRYLLLQFVNIADGDLPTKFTSALKLSLVASPFILIWDKLVKWGIPNQDYILIVLGAILFDWFFGMWKHLKKRTFSFKQNAYGLIIKISLTTGAAFLFEGLGSIVKDSADIIVLSLTTVTRVIVFLYPAVSAWQNIYIVSDERFPPKAWMDKINKFNENLDVKELTDEKAN